MEISGRPPRILIVDDSNALRALIRRELAPLGVVTEEAENGKVALEVAARFAPDFITLDLDMPVLDGYQTCEDLKAREATMHIPVLIVSANPDDASRLRALAAGAISTLRIAR